MLFRYRHKHTPGISAQNANGKKNKRAKKNNGTKTNVTSGLAGRRQDTTDAGHWTDQIKKLKNLRKKLREIEALEQKIKEGILKNPDQEMRDKVSRKRDIQNEIRVLESNQ